MADCSVLQGSCVIAFELPDQHLRDLFNRKFADPRTSSQLWPETSKARWISRRDKTFAEHFVVALLAAYARFIFAGALNEQRAFNRSSSYCLRLRRLFLCPATDRTHKTLAMLSSTSKCVDPLMRKQPGLTPSRLVNVAMTILRMVTS